MRGDVRINFIGNEYETITVKDVSFDEYKRAFLSIESGLINVYLNGVVVNLKNYRTMEFIEN